MFEIIGIYLRYLLFMSLRVGLGPFPLLAFIVAGLLGLAGYTLSPYWGPWLGWGAAAAVGLAILAGVFGGMARFARKEALEQYRYICGTHGNTAEAAAEYTFNHVTHWPVVRFTPGLMGALYIPGFIVRRAARKIHQSYLNGEFILPEKHEPRARPPKSRDGWKRATILK